MNLTPESQATALALLSCFFFGGVCGVAEQMRAKRHTAVCLYELLAAFIYSACLGTVISLFYYHWYGSAGSLLAVGIAGVVGLGGLKFTDFLLNCVNAGGLSITLSPRDVEHVKPDDSEDTE